jgi:ubiquitin-like domain-containing CTD phosphatase 1
VDDLGRNFALNPTEGLKIHAFKHAHTAQARSDRQLYQVGKYMVHIAQTASDFTQVDHNVGVC